MHYCLNAVFADGRGNLGAALSVQGVRAEQATEYRLATGDVIEITAVGAPDIRSKASVDLDGRALFPLIGPVKAAGITISAIQSNVRELLPSTSNYKKEKAHLKTALQKEQQRIDVLVAEREKEKEDADGDAAEFQATKTNLQRGFVPTTRVAEARRLALYSATRALQTSALIAQLDSQRHELESRLDRLDDQRRVRLLDELQNCSVKIAGISARLQAAGEKLLYAGMVRSQLLRGGAERPIVTVFRGNQSQQAEGGADNDTILMPGDVLEVAARTVSQNEK